MKVIPFFKSNYSTGKSILTIEKKGTSESNEPDSIIDIALENNLKKVFLIEDNCSSALQAYENMKDAGLQLTYGLRITCVDDHKIKDEPSFDKEHKVVVIARNRQAYENLCVIYTKSAQDGFYYEPRTDFEILSNNWCDGLSLWIPFYDSYLFKNLLTLNNIVPKFEKIEPIYVIEDHGLPFEFILRDHIQSLDVNVIIGHSIYYKKKDDFLAYLTRRAIDKRKTLEKPECEHMSSDSFCAEAWKEING